MISILMENYHYKIGNVPFDKRGNGPLRLIVYSKQSILLEFERKGIVYLMI